MKLTDKELEIMAVLWKSSSSMTANEIIETSNNRKWKDSAIAKYVVKNFSSVRKTGIHIDTPGLIKCLMSDEEG